MLNDIFSKGKSQYLDLIMGVFVFLLSTYLMLSSGNLGGHASSLSPELAAEIRSKYYSGQEKEMTLVVFDTSWCGACKALERQLKDKNLKFKTVDVESGPEAYSLYQKVYGSSSGPVPVTVAGNKVIVGNGLNEILEALAIKG